MLILKEFNPHDTRPYCCYGIAILCTLIFLFEALLSEKGFTRFLDQFALVPAELFQRNEWSTLLTNTFLHADLFHLLGNMIILLIFADNIEHAFGRMRFLLFYVMAAVVTSFTAACFSPDSTIPHLGASGAIMACCGAYFILFPKAEIQVMFGPIWLPLITEIKAFFLMISWFILDIIGFYLVDNSQGGISYMAHISGFLLGIIFGRILKQYDSDYDGYILPNGVWVRYKPVTSRRDEMLAKLGAKSGLGPKYSPRPSQNNSDSVWDKYNLE